MPVTDDVIHMAEALKEAGKAGAIGEVPVGAVIVSGGRVVARAHNRKEVSFDPSAHAEVFAIRKAAKRLRTWRLSGATLYVTLEPCVMCMGAIIQARIPRLVFGALDPKAGACGSVYDLSSDRRLNHRVEAVSGVMGKEASDLLKTFFSRLRSDKRARKG